MKVLLDTHIFLWFINDDIILGKNLKEIIENENNDVYLSIASLWEMSIKYSLGKLKLENSYEDFIAEEILKTSINLLEIQLNHLNLVSSLPFYHKDPFDRMIIAQSRAENMPIITVDSAFEKYSVNILKK